MAKDEATAWASRRASDVAYGRIQEMIVHLLLWPGSAVDEKSLAADLGLGRTPVREALQRLAAERLVTVLPRRGLLIPPIGLGEIREILEARMALECGTARLAARYAGEDDLQTLRDLVQATEDARIRTDFPLFLEADREVHLFVAHVSRNSFLEDAVRRILKHNERFWRYYERQKPLLPGTLISHRPLLGCLLDRDEDGAEAAMRQHVADARTLLHALF